jgi:hypothetical protein
MVAFDVTQGNTIMKLAWKIAWFAGSLISAASVCATPMTEVPTLEYSQDGVNFAPFEAITGKAKAGTYYDYHNASGHPGFGTAKALTSTAIYWDSRHDLLSLVLIAGTPGEGKGQLKVTVENLPDTAALGVADDPDEFKYKHGKPTASASFKFNKGTDGLVIGDLQGTGDLAVKVAVSSLKNINQWRLISGDETATPLDLTKPLYLRVTEVASEPATGHHHHHTPVEPPPAIPPTSGNSDTPGVNPILPEPAFGIVILGALGLLSLRPRR